MTSDKLDGVARAARERREADTRYNNALTALDGAIVAATNNPATDRDQFERLTSALIVFLQQITAFVESKDRELSAATSARFDQIDADIRSLSELRTQVGVLTRATKAIERTISAISAVGSPQSSVASPSSSLLSDDYKYVGFEDQFRGSDDAIQERLRAYVPIFSGRSDVLDVGCGRGEFLAALKAAGISARGVDANAEMAAVARERGLAAAHADALAHLASLPDGSLGGIIATQVVEHLEPPYLMRLLDTMAQKLHQGAPLVLETINPACWLAFFSSYIRDLTHVRPIHPETLQYLLRASGFERVDIRYSAPVPEHVKMKRVDLPADVLASTEPSAIALARVAHAVNANAVILNSLMFTHLDYAAVGYRS
ncbi:MAG TPA: class I SAM-dependent methyltransferase [Vicinamibacterales bacterium]|nr:class I SAM-dependent methyltransferase [Vicinamibacterales bacterium]